MNPFALQETPLLRRREEPCGHQNVMKKIFKVDSTLII